MSQKIDAWREIIEQTLGQFQVIDNAAPAWLVDAETGSRLVVDKLYPELGLVIRFKGAAAGALGPVAFMKEADRDAVYARLCREADMAQVVIDLRADDPARVLAELRTALSAAGRRIAQRQVAQQAKLSLLPRIASAKAACRQIAGAVASPDDLAPFARSWAERGTRSPEPRRPEPAAPAATPRPEPELEPVAPEPAPIAAPAQAGPVTSKERIEFVDILRGFALFGVLAFNMTGFAGQNLDLRSLTGGLDKAAVVLLRFLIQAKFYTLFSFLFGWGMSVQMARARARDGRFVPLYLRRLVILLAIGVLHGVFLWQGDILTAYALLGFALLLFRKRSPGFVLAAALIALLFRFVLAAPGEGLDAFRAGWENLTAFMRHNTYPASLYATGSFMDVSRLRLQDLLAALSRLLYYGDVFAMFLLGLYVGKREIFQQIDRHLPLVRRVMWGGLVIGAASNGVFVSTFLWPAWVPQAYGMFVAVGSRTLGAPAMMLFYVTAIILLSRQERWYQRLAPLANVGRSALSNYLLQSVICSLIFYGYGLGLHGEVGPFWGLVLTGIIYYAQVQLSAWWFDRYQFGPMEWLWRTLTYRRRQPLRLGETYDTMRPPLWRRAAARVHPIAALAGFWLLLLLWAGGLVLWSRHLDRAAGDIDLSPVTARATQTAVAEGRGASPASPGEAEAVATPVVQPVVYEPGPVAASGDLLALASTFSVESALAQIETLTGPPYLGRYAGSPQGRAAGDYIAGQFASFGLQPAGDDGSFFQRFPVEYVTLAGVPSLVVQGPDGTIYDDYLLHRDFAPLVRGYTAAGTASGELVWASNCTHQDLDAVPVLDKIVLCRNGSIVEAGRNALEHGAAGLLLLTDPERRPPDFGSIFFESWVPEPIPALRVYPSVVDELLLGSGWSVADLSIHFDPYPLATGVEMAVATTGAEACAADGCWGRNVLGVIPGRDPAYADQVIFIGAHYDHLGQAPDGTVWPGANDDASGVAVLLEIARSWHEAGYVPRHTVVFAAWDAEEMGLVGSGHYVAHPRYPLENTAAMIQLDMVGAGGDTLNIDGKGDLAQRFRDLAESRGIDAEITDLGRSDHVPFAGAGVPSALLIWQDEGGAEPQYHRPVDTAATIDPEKLQAVGEIVGLAVMDLSEGRPAIKDLLARRAAAVEAGDLAAFMDTSLPEQSPADRFWFADAQSLSPTEFQMQVSDVRVLGREAIAGVEMTLAHPAGEETEEKTASLDVRLAFEDGRWQWAGPNLNWRESEDGFDVAYPPGREEVPGLGEQAAEQYAQIASTLGLPAEPDADLMLFSSSKSLWASTGLSLAGSGASWVDPDAVKLVYGREISASTQLTDALVRLALAEAGVTESAAPWLWQGLPLVWRAQRDPVAAQIEYLPKVQGALAAETEVQNEATAWAAVDYLRQRAGWQGVGEIAAALGRACGQGLCEGQEGLSAALSESLQMDAAAFEAAWQTHWRDRLAAAQADLEVVLAARTEAVLAGDEAAFLSTVDPAVPNLMAEERGWFAALADAPVESFSLTGKPLAFLENDHLLASVTLQIVLAGDAESIPLQVALTPGGEGYRWAGTPFEVLRGSLASVLYPEGEGAMARRLLAQAEAILPEMTASLGAGESGGLTIKLYGGSNAFRASISPSFPRMQGMMAWAGKDASIKMVLREGVSAEAYGSELAVQTARHLLYRMGVEDEWLLRGVSLYLARSYDGGVAERAVTERLSDLLRSVTKDRLGGLAEIGPYDVVSGEEYLGDVQAWDAVRYLHVAYGWQTVNDLLRYQGQGLDSDAALQRAIGQTLAEFEAGWRASLALAHTTPEWVEVARVFDGERANEHVVWLARPELAGRKAGSPGAEQAADYIANRFSEFGLQPVGDEATFFQHFPISYTNMLATPRLQILDGAGEAVEEFAFREEFLLVLGGSGSEQGVSGELVWVRDGQYENLALENKIALRRLDKETDVGAEISQAVAHGAGGLILIGSEEDKKTFLSKTPLTVDFVAEEAIPVVELTQLGYTHLLEATGQTPPALLNSPPALPFGVQFRIEISLDVPRTVATANVLGLLPGSDPDWSQEVVILGAHYDHVGDDPGGLLYPGANDDASGVAVLLEIARLWHEAGYRPKRSVLFAAWGAQELGMLGSEYYLSHPVFSPDETYAALQLDAVGGGSGHYMEAQGRREREGLWLFNMEAAEDLVDGRLKLAVPTEMVLDSEATEAREDLFVSPFEGRAYQLLQAKVSDNVTFLQAGIPTLLVIWRGASEDNWPAELADEVEPYRLGVTGRMVTLATMTMTR